MSKYGEYRHIDLPWLKEIPAHWDIWRNKNIFTEIKEEVGENASSYTLLSLTLNGIVPRDVESGKGKLTEEVDTLHELRNKLISDVVTGQIDVRNIEVPDFEYVEETEDESDDDSDED